MSIKLVRRSSLAFLALLSAATAASAVNVCGPINASTTWTTANSPYTLTCDVRVLPGVTLTIDPGVIVRFDPNTSLVAEGGIINAIGTTGSHITFTSVTPVTPGAGVRVQGGQVDVRWADFSTLQSGVSLVCCGNSFTPPLNVDRCTFSSNQAGISGYTNGTCTISNSYFSSNTVAGGQAYQIYTFCTFQANSAAFNFAESITLEDCEIAGNGVGFSSPNGNGMVARRCHFHGNTVALDRVTHIERCLIEFNQVGVRIGTPYMFFFQCNNFLNNSVWNVEMNTDVTISAANNWWGTTNTADIDAGIKDGFDQVGLGFLQYAAPLGGEWADTSTCACTIPVFGTHPATQAVFNGNTATFTAAATATGTPTLQWLRNGVPLVNTARFSGVTTGTLTITPVAREGSEFGWTDAGQYTCRATNVCGVAHSTPATLTTPICAADFNGTGGITSQDLFDFLGAYFTGCP